MTKRLSYGSMIVIGLVAYAGWHAIGLILAGIFLGAVQLLAVRTHPRVRHTGFGSCHGTGESRHPLFPWRFRRCPRCNGGRLVSRGAGQFGAEHIRAEYDAGRAARRRRRRDHTWR